jgi:polyisoprenoid-binding protein YceI
MPRSLLPLILATLTTLCTTPVNASDYVIDTQDAHAFIQFKISHLGYSWLLGRFDRFSGEFSYDENDPASTSVDVVVDTESIDTNHAERDQHLRDSEYLDVKRYPQAHFVSTHYVDLGGGEGRLTGNLTLRGVTRPIEIEVKTVGAGPDPWGGYRRGFEGTTHLTLADYGITAFLGAAARQVGIYLSIEGVRKKPDNQPRKPGGLHL